MINMVAVPSISFSQENQNSTFIGSREHFDCILGKQLIYILLKPIFGEKESEVLSLQTLFNSKEI